MSMLIVLLLGLGVTAVLWTGTLFLQAYLYNEPVRGISWRAPVAGLVLTLLFGLWIYIDGKSPGTYDTLFRATTSNIEEYREMTAVKRYKNGKEKEETYVLSSGAGTRREYRTKGGDDILKRSGTDYMVIAFLAKDPADKSKDLRFDAVLKQQKQGDKLVEVFDIDTREGAAKFVEKGGRVMFDNSLGLVTVSSRTRTLGALSLNVLHFALWMVAFWPLLRYGFWEAFGLTVCMWLLFTLFLLPLVFDALHHTGAAR